MDETNIDIFDQTLLYWYCVIIVGIGVFTKYVQDDILDK